MTTQQATFGAPSVDSLTNQMQNLSLQKKPAANPKLDAMQAKAAESVVNTIRKILETESAETLTKLKKEGSVKARYCQTQQNNKTIAYPFRADVLIEAYRLDAIARTISSLPKGTEALCTGIYNKAIELLSAPDQQLLRDFLSKCEPDPLVVRFQYSRLLKAVCVDITERIISSQKKS